MKRSGLWLCMFGIVLWAGAVALAQDQGRGRGGAAGQARDLAAQAGGTQNKAPAADANAMDKVKAAKQDADAAKGGAAQRGKAIEEAQGKAKGQMGQQAEALKKQMQATRGKHLERLARLNRLREIAEKKGDKEMLARIDKLIAKQNEVFGRRQNIMQGQPRSSTLPTGPNDVAGRKGPAGKDAKPDVKDLKTPEAKPEKK